MQMGKFDTLPITSKKAKQAEEPKAETRKQAKSDFIRACEEAGKSPHTVRRRMKPKHKRGQGMTLEEALAAPVLTRSEAGRRNRKNLKGK